MAFLAFLIICMGATGTKSSQIVQHIEISLAIHPARIATRHVSVKLAQSLKLRVHTLLTRKRKLSNKSQLAHTANYLPAYELPESIGNLKKGNQLAIKIMKA